MAFSCGEAILKSFQGQEAVKNTAIIIKDMDMQEALIINDSPEPQIVKIKANYFRKQKKVEVDISSASNEGQTKKIHAKATVVFEDGQAEKKNLHQKISSIGSQIETLKSDATSGLTERFTTSMAYRMVASLAHYDDSHKGVKETYLNSTTQEAHAVVSTAARHRLQGDFAMHPCVFDSILQLATFVMNANENSRFDLEVYVVRGWESLFIDGVLSPDDVYETYVKMTAQDKDTSFGDIAVRKGDKLIGCIQGVRVQRVPRRLMDVMFKQKQDVAPAHPSSNDNANLTLQAEAKQTFKKSAGPSTLDKALSIIAEESGISIPEMKDDDFLGDLGIDSLLVLVIASRFREELNLDLASSFLMEVNTIGGIRAYFKESDSPSVESGLVTDATSSDSDTPSRSSGPSSVSDDSDSARLNIDSKGDEITAAGAKTTKKPPVSTSIILQGTMGPNNKTMFLFPDGSGSATSYMHLPRVHENVAVVAMNCPYMTTPTEMTGTFEDITAILLAEVRRRQPHGPYLLGGWSAGGAFAHYAARLLIEAGETVSALVLIDAPCPIGLGKLPESFFAYWRRIHQPGGMVEDRPLPSWIMDHFKAVNENLRWYNASPLPLSPRSPKKVYLVWAAKGTDNLAAFPDRHLLTEAESADLGFLMDDKSDFGPRGWEGLVEGKVEIERAMTSNHFTITRGEGARIVSGLIRKACLEG